MDISHESTPLKETNAKTLTPYGINRYILLAIYCIYCALTTSAIQQIVCLRFIMAKLGAYSWLCNGTMEELLPTGALCKSQDNYITICWTVGIMAPNIILSVLGLGRLFDYIGPKKTGFIGQSMFCIGILIIAFSNEFIPLYPLGFLLIGLPQGPIFNAVLSISNLFPKHSNKIISLLSTMGDLSAFVFYFIYHFHSYTKINLESILIFYSIFICGTLILVSVFLLPNESFQKYELFFDLEIDSQGHKRSSVSSYCSINTATVCSSDENNVKLYLHTVSLKKQLLSSYFMLYLPYFTLTVFRSDSIKACMDSFIIQVAGVDNTRYYMSVFSTLQCFSFVFSLINGYILDKIGITYGVILQNTLGLSVSILFLLNIPQLYLLTFLLFFLYCSCIFATAYCYLLDVFGFNNINFLIAIVTGPVGFAYMSIPFIYKLQGSQFFYFHMACIIVSIIMYITPLNLIINNPSKLQTKNGSEYST